MGQNIEVKNWPFRGVEKAWTQLCWISTKRQFLTCEPVISVNRTISWSERLPCCSRQRKTFCNQNNNNWIHNLKDNSCYYQLNSIRLKDTFQSIDRERERVTATRSPKWEEIISMASFAACCRTMGYRRVTERVREHKGRVSEWNKKADVPCVMSEPKRDGESNRGTKRRDRVQ